MPETKARHIANLVEDDGDVKSAHLDNITVTPTAVSDQANTSTGYIDVPSGTEAQRPGSPNAGNLRFNTDVGSLEVHSGTGWIATNEPTPTIASISGGIYAGLTRSLTITGTDFNTNNISIEWLDGTTRIVKEDSITPTSATSVTRSVPSSVYNKASGTTIGIRILNSGSVASNIDTSKSVTAVPTGGTITEVGTPTCYVHTFTTGANFINTISNLSVCYLVVAGGGGGGRYGGGGGAGGLLHGTSTLATGTTTAVIGNGASENTNGGCSSWNSIVTCGGGTGGWYGTGGQNGCNGGSGGGATFCYQSSTGQAGSGISGQGCDGGGPITWANTGAHASAGGGGATADGTKENHNCGGDGGAGAQNSINGTGHYWAGGGGGGTWTEDANCCGGEGGIGGGGAGRNTSNSDHGSNGGSHFGSAAAVGTGATNTGGGGGGGCSVAACGGSGIVILRYCLP